MENHGKCALTTNFQEYERKEAFWLEEREKIGDIYRAFSEYIKFLEKMLEQETDLSDKYLIECKIKKLIKERRNYQGQSIMSMTKYELETDNTNSSKSKCSCLSRVKKIK